MLSQDVYGMVKRMTYDRIRNSTTKTIKLERMYEKVEQELSEKCYAELSFEDFLDLFNKEVVGQKVVKKYTYQAPTKVPIDTKKRFFETVSVGLEAIKTKSRPQS